MQPLWGGKAISIIYCDGVSVALVIQHAMHMRHIVICGLGGSTTRIGTLIVATIYLQLIQNRYMFRSFTAKGILRLPHRWQRAVHNAGDYTEGQ